VKCKKFTITPYLFIAPHLVFFITFLIIPTIIGIWISFHHWDYLTPSTFVGFENYISLLTPGTINHRNFMRGMTATFIFVLLTVPINIVLSLIIAAMLNHLKFFKNFFRMIFYIPVVMSVTVVTIAWTFMASREVGLINQFLAVFNVEPIPWLVRQPHTWIILAMTTIWWMLGRNILYYVAGLTDISPDQYESASLDGANGIQKFFYITIPNLKRTILFVAVIETIAQFNIFGQPNIMTEGGPAASTRVALMVIRETAFSEFRMGMASAMSVLLGLVIIVFSAFQFRLFMSKD